jgi:hypothetical protein
MIKEYEREFEHLRNNGLPGAVHYHMELIRLKRMYAATLDTRATLMAINAAVDKEMLKIFTGFIMLEDFYAELPN